MQTIVNYSPSSDLTSLYYAVDVVVANISKYVYSVSMPNPNLICLLYFVSFTIFFGIVLMILRDMETECVKLECFLKFFSL